MLTKNQKEGGGRRKKVALWKARAGGEIWRTAGLEGAKLLLLMWEVCK